MGGLGSISPTQLESIVRNTNVRSDTSLLIAKKALNVQKNHGDEAIKLINSASQIKTSKIDLKV